jgi:glycine/D-amino acid oxidase-like deaminating enzyme
MSGAQERCGAGVHSNELIGPIFSKEAEARDSPFWTKFNIQPVKGQIWVTDDPAPPGFQKHILYTTGVDCSGGVTKDLLHDMPNYCTHDWRGHRLLHHAYGRQNTDGTISFGGARIKVEEKSLRNEVDKHALKESQEFVSSFFPYLKRYPATNAWSGLMPFSMDGKPILNSFAKYGHPNLFIAGGFGGEGIMYGPGCSKIFAAWMLGKENVIKDQPVVFETFKHVWGALS